MTGRFSLTFQKACWVVQQATGNHIYTDPRNEKKIRTLNNTYLPNEEGIYPRLEAMKCQGGLIYTACSGRRIWIYPDSQNESQVILDCSDWWKYSTNFRNRISDIINYINKKEK